MRCSRFQVGSAIPACRDPLKLNARPTVNLSRALLVCVSYLPMAVRADPPFPIRTGQYQFQMKDAEFPTMPSVSVRVTVDGTHVEVVVADPLSNVFPNGALIDEGILMWHPASHHWIIGHDASDRNAAEVGGCSAGPAVVDVKKRIYWTC